MILDDLLIHGDWLEENDINNIVYKLFLNLLKIELRRNDNFGWRNGFGVGGGGNAWGNGYSGSRDGNGYMLGDVNGNYSGNGLHHYYIDNSGGGKST